MPSAVQQNKLARLAFVLFPLLASLLAVTAAQAEQKSAARESAAAASQLQDRTDPYATSLVIVNGFLVFFMQVGFLAYETGSGRAKNVRNILLKNLLDVMLAAIVWWAVGYGFAYGKSAKGIIGTNLFFHEGGSTFDKSTRPWFFSWTFCIASCTIISGCLAERTALSAYPVATLLISGVVHPLLVHWLWSPYGWMSNIGECQVLDFAGGMVVHMLGGLFGLMGAWQCGPRLGRFELAASEDEDDEDEEQQQDPGPAAGSSRHAYETSAAAAVGGSRVSWDTAGGSAAAAAAAAGCGGHRLGEPGAGLMGLGHQALPAVATPATGGGDAHSTGTGNSSPLPVISAAWAAEEPVSSGGSFPGWPAGARLAAHDGGSTAFSDSPVICSGIAAHKAAAAGHDMAFVTLGTFMLWFGWFGFNNGSVYMYVSGNTMPGWDSNMANIASAEVVQRTSMNTALGGASGGLTALLVAAIFSGTYDLRICCNGVLSGLVTVTCMCGFVDPWAAVVCSGIAGAIYTGVSTLLLRCGIDDPLDSSAVHLGNGLLGTLMLAFVAKPEHVLALTGSPCGGVFYSSTGWLQLGLQLMGVVLVIVVAGGSAWIMFWVLARKGLLRVDQVTELAGIDNMDHGGPAYPEFAANSFLSAGGGQNAASAGRRMLQ
ncbi:hypothetical protein OEZ86_005825 [Tetradesmus obliquus]|nr:hypothetical protein OEZ86_005825 [Tetradesmus obliquus]